MTMIEKCANFERWINPRNKIYNEVQICRIKGVGDMMCGGFRDGCQYPKLFIPYTDVDTLTLEQMREPLLRELWEISDTIFYRTIPNWSPPKRRR